MSRGRRKLSQMMKDENIGRLHGRKKLEHIWTYYKFPLIILCILLYFLGYALYRYFTHKDTVLYTALVNVVAGETLTGQLGKGFVEYRELDTAEKELGLYTGLYLTDDEMNIYHEYTYASRMKIMAAIEGEMLDVVLMNKEAFDAFAQNGYLCDLHELLSGEKPDLLEAVKPDLVNNIFILEDNSADRIFDQSIPYTALTEEHLFGLDVSHRGFIGRAGFEDTVYVGIIANSPRKDMAIAYLQYLIQD